MARTADTGGETKPGPSGAEQKVSTRPETATVAGPRTGLRRLWPGSTLLQHSLLMLLAFVGMMLLIETVDPFRVSQLASMAYYVPAVAGLTLLTGINGQISLGHGGLMAVAGYTTAVLLEKFEGLPFVVVLLVAVVVTAVVGVVVGAAASRLHGPYLAGATLAFAVGLPGIALYFEEELGGEQGLRVSPPDAPGWFDDVIFFITGADMSGTKYLAYLGWILALLVLLLLSNLLKSRYGRVWRAVRDDEVAAELAGINLGRARVLAFVVSAVCAGVAGSMLAVVARLVAPSSFTVTLSIFLLVAIVVGGLGSLVGALIGSALLVFLVPFVTDRGLDAGLNSAQAANFAPLVFGIFLVVVMLAAPQGIVGTIRTRWLTSRATRARTRA
ncbi:MAG: ABC transporter, permease protein 2 (cluster 4, leucine/isoleucine/valine/benzoate) [uncultured Frankineae bacterium]|uniref:ABC transporter, permease protein 2 (Cluster 4, leucine/isoleucine/valine/benzoate) n=1 Tax=uncultured Frankineae bacterium TaxID=437475 RepID=A0A6J4KXD1_9ACTN|nr:MAG: ABC transporter, permease protein 2 (cluster 4, leucine/isoleucine/valine/benzoate) [uncultured Frankineae bacterium]